MDLRALILSEPLNAGKTDQQVLDWLNENVGRNLVSLTGDQIRQASDEAGYSALTGAKKAQWLAFCSGDSIDPFGVVNVAIVKDIFGDGSQTVTNLAGLRVEQIQRWHEASDARHPVTLHEVGVARAL